MCPEQREQAARRAAEQRADNAMAKLQIALTEMDHMRRTTAAVAVLPSASSTAERRREHEAQQLRLQQDAFLANHGRPAAR